MWKPWQKQRLGGIGFQSSEASLALAQKVNEHDKPIIIIIIIIIMMYIMMYTLWSWPRGT